MIARLKEFTEVWSKGQKATRSSVSMARHLSQDAILDAALGKRDQSELTKQEIEQSSISETIGGQADPISETVLARHSTANESLVAELASGLVEEKLKRFAKWPANLKNRAKSATQVEPSVAPISNAIAKEKDKSTFQSNAKRLSEPVSSQVLKKKQERWESMQEEELMTKEKLTRRENPFKIKNWSSEEIYYPEDFLVRGLFSTTSKNASKRYIDLKMELAFPLSQNIILRNENVVSLSQLEGRLYKYLDENNSIKTLQFIGSLGEELIFIDLLTNRKLGSFRGDSG